MEPVASIVQRHGGRRDACIKILQEIQTAYGYLPKEVLRWVTDHSSISPRQIYGVATFYEWFRFQPVGKHMIRTCDGTACHVNGARQTTREVQEILGIKDRETTADGMFTLESVACLGCCSLAPVMMVGEQVFGRLAVKDMKKLIQDYRRKHAHDHAPAPAHEPGKAQVQPHSHGAKS